MRMRLNNGHIFTYQAPEVLNQAAPVQNTWYTIGTITNAILYNCAVNIEDTNETLEVQITIDGETIQAVGFAATHSTPYYVSLYPEPITRVDRVTLVSGIRDISGIPLYGKSIKIEVRKTTAAGAGNLTGIMIHGSLEAI